MKKLMISTTSFSPTILYHTIFTVEFVNQLLFSIIYCTNIYVQIVKKKTINKEFNKFLVTIVHVITTHIDATISLIQFKINLKQYLKIPYNFRE